MRGECERRDRQSSKAKRDWPRRKDHRPPKPPILLMMTEDETALFSRPGAASIDLSVFGVGWHQPAQRHPASPILPETALSERRIPDRPCYNTLEQLAHAAPTRSAPCRSTIGPAFLQGSSIISTNSGPWKSAAISTVEGCRWACPPLWNSEAVRERRMS